MVKRMATGRARGSEATEGSRMTRAAGRTLFGRVSSRRARLGGQGGADHEPVRQAARRPRRGAVVGATHDEQHESVSGG